MWQVQRSSGVKTAGLLTDRCSPWGPNVQDAFLPPLQLIPVHSSPPQLVQRCASVHLGGVAPLPALDHAVLHGFR